MILDDPNDEKSMVFAIRVMFRWDVSPSDVLSGQIKGTDEHHLR